MDVIEVQIAIDELRPGMYVNRPDRDWVGTPFPLQGFYVTKTEQIEELRKYCRHVFVDTQRQQMPVEVRTGGSNGAIPARTGTYANTRTFAEESQNGRRAWRESSGREGEKR